MPPMWLYYTEVANLDAAMERAKKRGANLMNGPLDVPGGRIAQFMDPQGAAFALHQGSPK
jgi:predicted enzyme related to lactoylglutathione lyase